MPDLASSRAGPSNPKLLQQRALPTQRRGLNRGGDRQANAALCRIVRRRLSVLKAEYVHRHTFATRTEARIRIVTWITDFYNVRRLHSVCGFTSP